MNQRRSFIFLELNEVPIRVVRHFAERHPNSAFGRILEVGRRWDTLTPDTGHLSPWITWPTLHRGVPGSKHGIRALGQPVDEVDRKYPPVWSILAGAGRSVGMFGSLHSYPLPPDADRYAFYLPDTFAAGPEAHPAELSAFQRFNLHMVDRSGRNVSSDLPVKEAFSFFSRSLPAGVRPMTLVKIARQLASERIWKHRSARRRTIQSILGFDLFLAQVLAKRPDASFFFTNHVASSMHRYWPATFTGDYQRTSWSADWVQRFSGEVEYAMGEADQMLDELMAFADKHPEYIILVAGSMGQAAVDHPDRKVSTEVLLHEMDKFLAILGIGGGWHRRRTMEPTYTLAFDEPADADAFMAAIAQVKIAGSPVRHQRLDRHAVEFVLGQNNLRDDHVTLTLGNRSVAPADAGIANVPIQDEVGAAAYHVPEGMLLAYDPRRTDGGGSAETVLTTRIAPTLLALQGLEPLPHMDQPIEGLLSRELEPA